VAYTSTKIRLKWHFIPDPESSVCAEASLLPLYFFSFVVICRKDKVGAVDPGGAAPRLQVHVDVKSIVYDGSELAASQGVARGMGA